MSLLGCPFCLLPTTHSLQCPLSNRVQIVGGSLHVAPGSRVVVTGFVVDERGVSRGEIKIEPIPEEP